MKVNVELTCPVSVIVDTDTGDVLSVHVWDEALGDQPVAVHRDEYIPRSGPNGEFMIGTSIFEPLPVTHPDTFKALEIVAADDIEWPAWEFGS